MWFVVILMLFSVFSYPIMLCIWLLLLPIYTLVYAVQGDWDSIGELYGSQECAARCAERRHEREETKRRREREEIRRKQDEEPSADIFQAVRKNRIKEVKDFVEKGVNVNSKDCVEECVLGIAALYSDLDLVKYLVTQGADIHAKNKLGQIPLFFATQNPNIKVLEYLILQGSNINAKDRYDRTPLHEAAWNRNAKYEVLEYLIAHGADVNAKNNMGKTPLDFATDEHKANRLRKAMSAVPVPPPSSPTPAVTPVVSSDTAAPSKPQWYYYDHNGDKISVTVAELKALAQRGVITPGTTIENAEGKTAIAKKVKGLTFADAQYVQELQETEKTDNRNECVSGQATAVANADGQSKPAPVSPQATFNPPYPPTPGQGLVSLSTLDRDLGILELNMGRLKMGRMGQRGISETAVRYLRELAQYDSSKNWASRTPAKQAAITERERGIVEIAEAVLNLINISERTLADPNATYITPEYRQAFAVKAKAFRDYVNAMGLHSSWD